MLCTVLAQEAKVPPADCFVAGGVSMGSDAKAEVDRRYMATEQGLGFRVLGFGFNLAR